MSEHKSQPIVWPHLQRFKSIPELQARAEELFPDNRTEQEKQAAKALYPDRPTIRDKWVAAIIYLRNNVDGGWRGDQAIPVKPVPPTRFARAAGKGEGK